MENSGTAPDKTVVRGAANDEREKTRDARRSTSDGERSTFFSLWLSWQELQGRRVIFFINVILIALLIALPVSLDLIGKARKSSVETRVDYIGPSLILAPRGILSSDLVTGRLKGMTFDTSLFGAIQREFPGHLRNADAMLTLRMNVDNRALTVTGIDFRRVHSYPFARFSPGEREVLLGRVAAEKLNKTRGDTLRLNAGEFTVAGIIPTTGGIHDASLFLSLPVLQEMTGHEGRINEVRLFPLSESSYLQMKASLEKYRTHLNIIDTYRGETAERNIDTTLSSFQKALYAVAFVLIALCIMISTYINLDGRKSEVSTVHTLGVQQEVIFQVLTFRTVWITLLGSFIGQLIALLVAALQDMHVPLRFIWSTRFFIEVSLATIALGMLVTIPFAVYMVYRRNPVADL